jgi:hypothetical protein
MDSMSGLEEICSEKGSILALIVDGSIISMVGFSRV